MKYFFRTLFVFLLGWFNWELGACIIYSLFKIPRILTNNNLTNTLTGGIMVYQYVIFLHFAIQIVMLSAILIIFLFIKWYKELKEKKASKATQKRLQS